MKPRSCRRNLTSGLEDILSGRLGDTPPLNNDGFFQLAVSQDLEGFMDAFDQPLGLQQCGVNNRSVLQLIQLPEINDLIKDRALATKTDLRKTFGQRHLASLRSPQQLTSAATGILPFLSTATGAAMPGSGTAPQELFPFP